MISSIIRKFDFGNEKQQKFQMKILDSWCIIPCAKNKSLIFWEYNYKYCVNFKFYLPQCDWHWNSNILILEGALVLNEQKVLLVNVTESYNFCTWWRLLDECFIKLENLFISRKFSANGWLKFSMFRMVFGPKINRFSH